MFQLTIQTGNQSWPFLFKNKEKAEAARDTAAARAEVNSHSMVGGVGHSCKIVDDFGRIGEFSAVTAIVFEDMDQSMFANIALALHNQHTQMKFNDAAKRDPLIMSAAKGPGVITPMGVSGRGMA